MRITGVLVGLQLLLPMVLAQPVFAACAPGRTPHDTVARYVGTISVKSSLTGVYSTVKEYDPYYSGANAAGTNVTVMLNRKSSDGSNAWAQFGWFDSKIQSTTAVRRSGLEFYVSANDNRFRWFPAQPVGSNNRYEIRYTGGGVYDFRFNGVRWDTESGIANPTEFQMFGETHDRYDQMPGGSNAGSRVKMSSSRYLTGSSFTINVATANFGTDWGSWYGYANPSDGNFEMWDKACAN